MTSEKRNEMKVKFFQLPEFKILELSIVGGGKKSEGDATVEIFPERLYPARGDLLIAERTRVYNCLQPLLRNGKHIRQDDQIDEKNERIQIPLLTHPGTAAQLAMKGRT